MPYVLACLSLAGLGVSGYLTYSHYADSTIVCAGLGQCDYVNSSDYAKLASIPVALLGMFAYGALLGAAVAWVRKPSDDVWPVAFWGLALAGAGYAGYLTYVELAVLKAICIWCVVSAIMLVSTLVLSSAYLFLSRES